MIAFDPDTLDIEQDYKFVDDSDGNPSINLSYKMTVPNQGGTAYIRISPELRDFFKLCHEKHGVIGFEYDFEEAGLNFGLIVKKGEKDGTTKMS